MVKRVATIGYWSVLASETHPNVIAYHSGLMVDADGHPQAYHPGPVRGLDLLANAGRAPHDWWGIAVSPKGDPYVQGEDDPAPGYYVSTTALEDPSKPVKDPSRYVHSGKVPFIVLPPRPVLGPKLGDLAMVLNPANGASSAAIFADVGPAWHLGEGSIALAQNLGVNHDPVSGGVGHGIVTVVFKGSGKRYPMVLADMAEQANGLFRAMGGYATVRSWFPDFDWGK